MQLNTQNKGVPQQFIADGKKVIYLFFIFLPSCDSAS
jgi:membrane-bound acyltransferase YfiQ involved in biofilm formation